MQKVTREILLAKAAELLSSGTVNRVLGWKAGEFTYDVTPALFNTAEELEKDFVYGPFCGANFSKYLVKETKKDEGIYYDKKREWNKIVDRAMAADFSWSVSARKYQEMYDWLIG